jgi:hypothetical protein
MLLDGITLRAIGYSASTAELIASGVVDRIRLLWDGDLLCTFKPSLLRKFQEIFNANADTLAVSKIYVPISRHLDPDRGMGFRDIKQQFMIEADVIGTYPANTTFTDLKINLAFHPQSAQRRRGDIYACTVLSQPTPTAGWNVIEPFQYNRVSALTKLYFDATNITEIKIWLGSKLAYHRVKEDALFDLQVNPIYKNPSGITHAVVAGQTTTSTGGFPVVLDDYGRVNDSFPLVDENGRRIDVKVEYYVDTGLASAAGFDIMAEGIIPDNSAA